MSQNIFLASEIILWESLRGFCRFPRKIIKVGIRVEDKELENSSEVYYKEKRFVSCVNKSIVR